MRGEYNGLTGQEVLEALLLQLRERLSKEGRLGLSQAYHNVVLKGRVELHSYPHEPAIEEFKLSAEVGEKPEGQEPVTATVTFEANLDVPDLVREQLEEAKSDVDFITQAEARGV